MKCTPFTTASGGWGFFCGSFKVRKKDLCSCGCRRLADRACDFPVGDKTCDKPLHRDCARQVGPERDYCPGHPHRPDPDADFFADLPVVTK